MCQQLCYVDSIYLQAYGLKFIINVEGLAWKFSLKNIVLNVGNGLALLGITTVVCEFVIMYFIKVSFLPAVVSPGVSKFSLFQEKNSVAQKKYDYVKEPQQEVKVIA